MVKIEPLVADNSVSEPMCNELFKVLENENADRWEFLPYTKPCNKKDFIDFINSLVEDEISPYVLCLGRGDSARYAGLICLMPINPASGVFEIGHVFLAKCALRSSGSKAGIKAIYLLLKHCFENKARRVQWRCHHMNIGSQRLASYLGFTKEGVFRKADFYKGMNRDTVWFSIVYDEWPTVNNRLLEVLKN